MKADSIL